MWISALLLAGGLALLVVGGEALVRGASSLALRLGIAPVVIGMTVVAFGTSTPELVVNVAAALRGNTGIGFGNVVGSNIANIGLLLGLTVLVTPLVVHRTIVVREIPMLLLACVATVVIGTGPTAGRDDGLLLLLLFAVFLYYTAADAVRQRDDPFAQEARERAPAAGRGLAPVALVVAGLAALVAGGEGAVRGAVGLATDFGIDETLVGLTVVAVGTSLPELATSIVAARRGQADLAVGNIVGSNIFNLLFVWGLSSSLAPAPLPAGGLVSLLVMTGFAAVLLPLAITGGRIGRLEGGLLLGGYAAYVGWLVVG